MGTAEGIHLGVLAILGISVFGGILGAWFFQRVRIPQVVGYIAVGLLIGQSGLRLVHPKELAQLQPFNLFALGIIGFLVGGELKLSDFRRYGKQFTAILLGEGILAFLAVGLPSSLILYAVTRNLPGSVAGGIVFGAIASATDPASTIDVLWEYRCRGLLTTAITAVVALDDALAMTLYGLGTSVAQILAGGSASLTREMGRIGVELLGALLLGLIFALLLNALVRHFNQPERLLALSIGMILLLISIAAALEMDVILAAMMLGFVLINRAPRRSERIFKVMRGFATPIYVLFFVLVGARLSIAKMPAWIWAIVAVYVIGRSGGKIVGTWLGARAARSPDSIRRYLGLGLFAQGGVAVGLSIMASQRLSNIQTSAGMSLGDVIIFGVTATTLIVQIVGPPMVKLSVKLAGEIGRNVTEEDVVEELKVADAMVANVVTIEESEPLRTAIHKLVNGESVIYPVVNRAGKLVGFLSLDSLKQVLVDQTSWQWLLATDAMQPVADTVRPDTSLKDALHLMASLNVDQLPVVDAEHGDRPAGILDRIHVRNVVTDLVVTRCSGG